MNKRRKQAKKQCYECYMGISTDGTVFKGITNSGGRVEYDTNVYYSDNIFEIYNKMREFSKRVGDIEITFGDTKLEKLFDLMYEIEIESTCLLGDEVKAAA